MTPPTKLLRVSTDYFVAGAIWSKIYGVWSCTDAAPILHWMRGLTTAAAKIALLKMGAAFEWIAPSQQATPSPSPMRTAAQPAPDTQGTPPAGMTCPLDPLNSKAGAPPVRANPRGDAPAIR